MESINFNDGFKEYKINGDEHRKIRVHLTDLAIVTRMHTAMDNLKGVKLENTPEGAAELNRIAREQIDYVFGSGTSDVLFGNANCASYVGGKPCFMNFFEAIAPIIKSDILAERAKVEANVKKYTDQVKK